MSDAVGGVAHVNAGGGAVEVVLDSVDGSHIDEGAAFLDVRKVGKAVEGASFDALKKLVELVVAEGEDVVDLLFVVLREQVRIGELRKLELACRRVFTRGFKS